MTLVTAVLLLSLVALVLNPQLDFNLGFGYYVIKVQILSGLKSFGGEVEKGA